MTVAICGLVACGSNPPPNPAAASALDGWGSADLGNLGVDTAKDSTSTLGDAPTSDGLPGLDAQDALAAPDSPDSQDNFAGDGKEVQVSADAKADVPGPADAKDGSTLPDSADGQATGDAGDGGTVVKPDAGGDGATADAKVDSAADADSGGGCNGKPAAPEACNNKDDDCDGETDEGETLCDDKKQCTIDICGAGQCIHMLPPDGSCEDGSECTVNDSCVGTQCLPGQLVACGDGNPCTTNGCDPKLGCVFEPSSGLCDDGNPCTVGDSCVLGLCKSATATTCDDANPCTSDNCVGPTGCQYLPNSAPCSDGSDCTVGDLCASGTCKPGKGQICDDGNACTTDSCTPGQGCSSVGNSAACEDGNACTQADGCVNSACKAGTAKVCDDGNPCTQDACDPLKGCVASNLANGTLCPTGTCTTGACVGKVCGNGKVEPGETCDDGNLLPCDACNATCTGVGAGVSGALGGNYKVAAVGGDFATFGAALKVLGQCGVKAAATFTVAAGTYSEPGFLFPVIPGASALTPVVFQAAVPGTVKLSGVVAATSYSGIIKVDSNAKHLTLDGFDLDGTLAANKIPGSYSGPIVFGSGGGQQSILLKRLRIHDFAAAAWATNTYIGGVYLQQSGNVSNITIAECTFDNLAPPATFTTQGAISVRNGTHTALRIVGNRFSGIKGMHAINLRSGTGWKDLVIANNFFALNDSGAVQFYSGATLLSPVQLYDNTVLLSGLAKYALTGAVSGNTVDLRGNILVSQTTALTMVVGTAVGPAGGNCLNLKATPGFVATVPNVTGEPLFVSAAAPWDLHLKAGSPCLNQGVPLPGMTVDIDGQPRGLVPDLGADELP